MTDTLHISVRKSHGSASDRFPAGSFFGGFRTPALLPGPPLAPRRHPNPSREGACKPSTEHLICITSPFDSRPWLSDYVTRKVKQKSATI
jgi:hypothetical protein